MNYNLLAAISICIANKCHRAGLAWNLKCWDRKYGRRPLSRIVAVRHDRAVIVLSTLSPHHHFITSIGINVTNANNALRPIVSIIDCPKWGHVCSAVRRIYVSILNRLVERIPSNC